MIDTAAYSWKRSRSVSFDLKDDGLSSSLFPPQRVVFFLVDRPKLYLQRPNSWKRKCPSRPELKSSLGGGSPHSTAVWSASCLWYDSVLHSLSTAAGGATYDAALLR